MERMIAATAAAEERHFWFRGLRRNAHLALTRALAGRTPRLILDCGAGTGRNLEWLSSFGPAIGLERSPLALDFARAKQRRVVAGSVTHLPFADGCADVVTSFDVFYCLDDLEERLAAREMYRVLRPGGIVLMNVAALKWLRGSHSPLTQERRRYTKPELREMLESTGFVVERITYTNTATLPLVAAVRGAEQLTGRDATPSASYLTVPAAPVNVVLTAMLAAEHAWLRVGNLPIGSSVLAVARKPGATLP